MANNTILSTIFNNQKLLLGITSGLNVKIGSRVQALSSWSSQISANLVNVSSAVSGMLADYNKVVPELAISLYNFINDQKTLDKQLSAVLTGFLPDLPVSSVIVSGIQEAKDYADEVGTTTLASAKSYASGIVESTSSFISGVIGPWTTTSGTVASRITKIESDIGGGGSGEGLGTRVERLETATNISITSGTPIINSTTQKLDTSYNPVAVASIDDETGKSNINKVQFIGDCKVTYGANGEIIIRIGQNLNSSNWNTKDGKTDGLVSRSFTPNNVSYYPDLLADTSSSIGVLRNVFKNTGTVTIKPAGLIHFANNSSTYISGNVCLGKSGTATTYCFGPITGNGTYIAKTGSTAGTAKTGLSATIANFGNEALLSAGATGYQANAQVTFDAKTFIGAAEKDFYITNLKHVNGSEATVIWDNDERIFFTNDTTTKPVIGGTPSLSVTATTNQVKTRSGVKYLTGGTVTAGVTGITKLADPCAVATKINVATDNQAWLTAFDGANSDLTGYNQKSDDTVSFSKSITGNLRHGQFSDCDIKITATNCNGSTTKNSAENLKLLIDTTSSSGTSDLVESFNDESRRLASVTASTDTAFDGTATLVGTNGLQIKNTTLMYPNGDYTGYNNGIGEIVGSNQPNYSSMSGDKYYMRKFTIGGDVNSVTVNITGTNIESCVKAGTLSFEMMNKQDAAYGATWKNVTFGQAGAIYVGADSKFTSSSGLIKVVFGNGSAAGSIYFRIKMTGTSCNATITKITVA